VALNQKGIIHFSSEIGIRLMNYGKDFLHVIESYQKLRGRRLLVMCNA
jgi:hypothetical protein